MEMREGDKGRRREEEEAVKGRVRVEDCERRR